MSLFSRPFQGQHFIPRDPAIDEDVNHTPIHGDVLAYDSVARKFVSATPPIDHSLSGTAEHGDLIVWDEALGLFTLQHPAYGTIYVSAGVAAEATTDTQAKLTAFAANGIALNVTPDHTDDSLTILEDGQYMINFSASYTHTAATSMLFSLRVDGVGSFQIDGPISGHVSLNGILELSAADVITVYVSNNTGGDGNLTVTNAQLSVVRVGPQSLV
jgi:hypothetical protein